MAVALPKNLRCRLYGKLGRELSLFLVPYNIMSFHNIFRRSKPTKESKPLFRGPRISATPGDEVTFSPSNRNNTLSGKLIALERGGFLLSVLVVDVLYIVTPAEVDRILPMVG